MKNICYYNNAKYVCINENLMFNDRIEIIKNTNNGNINNGHSSNVIIDNNENIIHKSWSFQFEFMTIFKKFIKDNLPKFEIIANDSNICQICKKKFNKNHIYIYNRVIWPASLMHYIKNHNIRPSHTFILFILNSSITNGYYIKINQNQLQTIDALLNQGGYDKKYKEHREQHYRFSEYAGFLKFTCDEIKEPKIGDISNKICKLKNIKILNTNTGDYGDKSIFFPNFGKEISKQLYIFHTHPPTPYPGGRASVGIVYEFPSDVDFYTYLWQRYNNRVLIGSIIAASEGIYIISSINNSYVNPTEELHKIITKSLNIVFSESYDKYMDNFNDKYFYSVIAQDFSFINKLNKLLKNYNIYVKYFPRQQNKLGKWVYGSIYLDFYNN